MIHLGKGLHGQAVEEIGRRIIRGDIPPGSALHPDKLEAELGVSKTVVREAMLVAWIVASGNERTGLFCAAPPNN